MMVQVPVPPAPPAPPPPFDPNLIFLEGGPAPWFFLMIVVAGLAATTIILWPIVRALARRLEGKGSGDPTLRADVEQLHSRLGEVDTLHHRVAELEERVDFAERLLAQAQPGRLGAPTEESGR